MCTVDTKETTTICTEVFDRDHRCDRATRNLNSITLHSDYAILTMKCHRHTIQQKQYRYYDRQWQKQPGQRLHEIVIEVAQLSSSTVFHCADQYPKRGHTGSC